jgi:hypothetical protein
MSDAADLPTEAGPPESQTETPAPEAAPSAEPPSAPRPSEVPAEAVPTAAPPVAETGASVSFASTQIWVLGLGLAAVAAVVLVAGTMLILRR